MLLSIFDLKDASKIDPVIFLKKRMDLKYEFSMSKALNQNYR